MKYFAALVIVAVVSVLVAGLFTIGSPFQQRLLRFDEQRVSDLMMMQQQIIAYWQSKQSLPENLDALADPLRGFAASPRDPQTGDAYSYAVSGRTSFRLCAVFSAESMDTRALLETKARIPYPIGIVDGTWEHKSGTQCFDRTIDPDFFPPIKPTKERL